MTHIITMPPAIAERRHIEQAVVEWREKRIARLAQEKIADEMKREETALKEWLITAFLRQSIEGVMVEGRVTGTSSREVPRIADREAFQTYVLDTRQLDLLESRPAAKAIVARIESGVLVPGIEFVEIHDLFNRTA